MKRLVICCMLGLAAGEVGAVPFRGVSLPSVDCLDTEVTTNVSITAWQLRAAKFAFSLSCIATPSNNVEAAFGEECKMENG